MIPKKSLEEYDKEYSEKVFGKLQAISADHFDDCGNVYFRFKCLDCGCDDIVTNLSNAKKFGKSVKCNCNKSRVELGKTYGNLKVIGEDLTPDSASKKYYCQCTKCGDIISTIGSSILKFGKSSQCSCYKKTMLVGKTFGNIEVIEALGNGRYKCRCTKCGDEIIMSNTSIKSGKSRKCSCNPKNNINVGDTIGDLKILGIDSFTPVKYKCKCMKCGAIINDITKETIVRYGRTKKCNCHAPIEIGKVYNKIKVISINQEKTTDSDLYYNCQCIECGDYGVMRSDNIKRYGSMRCSCSKAGSMMSLKGKTYGKLTVLSDPIYKNGRGYYLVRCNICNWEGEVRKDTLTEYGATSKCNCPKHKNTNKSESERIKNDLTGMIRNNIKVLKLDYIDPKSHRSYWICQCLKCGDIFSVLGSNITTDNTTQCRKCADKQVAEKNTLDLTNQVFGDTIALYIDWQYPMEHKLSETVRSKFWRCKCLKCGEEFTTGVSNLTSGRVTCCPHCASITHGMSGTKFYRTWCNMKDRCYNPNSVEYNHYGGRGITVCERWLDFDNFMEDMYESFCNHMNTHDSTTIERIDVNKGYSPSNCRWATITEQSRNKTTSKKYKLPGYDQELTIPDIYDLGICDASLSINTLYTRMSRGWDIMEAIKSPYRQYARKMITIDEDQKNNPNWYMN